MPKGVPVATVAIGENGSSNAALLAAQILGLNDLELQERIYKRRKKISEIIEKESDVNE